MTEDKKEWNFGSLIFEEDKAKYVESKIFEQFIFTKVWHVIAEFLIENTVFSELIEQHILWHN